MKESSVVQAFDQIGAPVGDLKDLAGSRIQLNLPPVPNSNFQHPPGRANIETVDVFPALDVRFRNRLDDLQDTFEREAWLRGAATLRRRLDPVGLFFVSVHRFRLSTGS